LGNFRYFLGVIYRKCSGDFTVILKSGLFMGFFSVWVGNPYFPTSHNLSQKSEQIREKLEQLGCTPLLFNQ
jgi:hypothetical protein